jgi:hypothetical protein
MGWSNRSKICPRLPSSMSLIQLSPKNLEIIGKIEAKTYRLLTSLDRLTRSRRQLHFLGLRQPTEDSGFPHVTKDVSSAQSPIAILGFSQSRKAPPRTDAGVQSPGKRRAWNGRFREAGKPPQGPPPGRCASACRRLYAPCSGPRTECAVEASLYLASTNSRLLREAHFSPLGGGTVFWRAPVSMLSAVRRATSLASENNPAWSTARKRCARASRAPKQLVGAEHPVAKLGQSDLIEHLNPPWKERFRRTSIGGLPSGLSI